jgi:hypothetical protein
MGQGVTIRGNNFPVTRVRFKRMFIYRRFRCNHSTRQGVTLITAAADNRYEAWLSNVMHVTSDGKRMYASNSLLSTLDHSGRSYARLVHIRPNGVKVDPSFNIDLNKLPNGLNCGDDMLIK